MTDAPTWLAIVQKVAERPNEWDVPCPLCFHPYVAYDIGTAESHAEHLNQHLKALVRLVNEASGQINIVKALKRVISEQRKNNGPKEISIDWLERFLNENSGPDSQNRAA
jgi:hypothetical protein